MNQKTTLHKTFRWLIEDESNLHAKVASTKFDNLYLLVKNPEKAIFKELVEWVKTIQPVINVTINSDSNNLPCIGTFNNRNHNLVICDFELSNETIADYLVRGRTYCTSCIYLTNDASKMKMWGLKQFDNILTDQSYNIILKDKIIIFNKKKLI